MNEAICAAIRQRRLIRFDYGGGEFAVFAVELREGVIAAMYLVANPDKLTHVSPRPN